MKMPNTKLVNVLTIADFNAEENIVNIWRLGNKDSKDSLNFVCAATLSKDAKLTGPLCL